MTGRAGLADFSADPFVPGEDLPQRGAQVGPLAGLRFVAKDNLDVASRRTGLGLPGHGRPATDHAAVIAACLAAGAVFRGKVTLDELAFSLLGLNQAYGAPLNPAAPGCVAGGSSCGSASAVAQGLADFGLGTDTAGSVRVPASFCGIWGLRPTHGAVSGRGMAPLSPSFDTPGWLCADAGLMVRVSERLLPPGDPGGVTTAIICDWLFDDDGRRRDAIAWARARRLNIVSQPEPPGSLAGLLDTFRTLQSHEAFACLGAFGDRADVPQDTRERIRAGSWIAPEQLDAARQARSALAAAFDRVATEAVLIAPAAPPPPRLSALDDPVARQAARVGILAHTVLASLAGAPQVVLPMWRDARGPVGLGVVAARGRDRALLALCVSAE